MAFPTFSILTPVYIHSQERLSLFYRAIDSVKNQSYQINGSQENLWEQIIIDDGSPISWQLPDYSWLKRLDQAHLERLYAYNKGLANSTKEWIVWLDSDDMLSPYYLEACSFMISKYPDYKVFNFGCLHFHPTFMVTPRGPFVPVSLEKGHEIFGGGQIVNGTFIFHRECYEKLGGFPEVTNPWDFSAKAQEEFPELRKYFTIVNEDNPQGVVKEMGNPMGNDFYYFYKLTREYHSKPLEIFLYMVFSKGQKELRV